MYKKSDGCSDLLITTLPLQQDVAAIESLEKSADYSTLFKIVLRDHNANRTGTIGERLSTRFFGRLHLNKLYTFAYPFAALFRLVLYLLDLYF